MRQAVRRALNDPTARFAIAALTEAVLPGVEFAMLVTDPVFWGESVPRGDGHPVLLIPGLLANDDYLRPLSNWLSRAGYSPIWSGLPIDPGFSEAAVRKVTERVDQEHRSTGSRVSIIGHSMGGALARSAALRIPNAVRHVITMGSPMFYEAQHRLSLSVALTAIHVRNDRIVRYPYALARDEHAENIEVRGSHSGLALNAEVYRHLARVLATAA
jgi:pimeloyl-ACP methyl ester carboxylesterase